MPIFGKSKPTSPVNVTTDSSNEILVSSARHYQSGLQKVAGQHHENGVNIKLTAELVPEPKNKHDPNAIRIEINGQHVGYVPREVAGEYQAVIRRAEETDSSILCDALVIGGRIEKGWIRNKKLDFGVRIYLPSARSALTRFRRRQ